MSFGLAAEWTNEFKRNEALGLVAEDINIMTGARYTILFSGQLGGHIRVHAWLQDKLPGGSVDYVHVYVDLYTDHYDPDDGELLTVKPFSQQNYYMTKASFLRVMGSCLASISV